MKRRSTRKLALHTEALMILSPSQLGAVRGGTDLANPNDPISAPPADSDKGGVQKLTAYTCICRTA